MRNIWCVALATALSSCSSPVPGPRYTGQPTSALVEVDFPPPPARVEFVPPQPAGDAVWVRGEWLWDGRRWAWKPGGWSVPPEGVAYAKWVLVRRADGRLFFAPGTWRNAAGQEVRGPEPISVARARSSAVVNPEGETEPTGPDVRPNGGSPDAGEGIDSR
jgi:hypothetical protein